jgi:hypothetical protein
MAGILNFPNATTATCYKNGVTTTFNYPDDGTMEDAKAFGKACRDNAGVLSWSRPGVRAAKRNKYSGFEGTEEEKKARKMKIIATTGGAVVGFAIAKWMMKTKKPMMLIAVTLVGAGAGFMVSKMMKK